MLLRLKKHGGRAHLYFLIAKKNTHNCFNYTPRFDVHIVQINSASIRRCSIISDNVPVHKRSYYNDMVHGDWSGPTQIRAPACVYADSKCSNTLAPTVQHNINTCIAYTTTAALATRAMYTHTGVLRRRYWCSVCADIEV